MAFPNSINRALVTTAIVCSVPTISAGGIPSAKADNSMAGQSSSSSQSGSGAVNSGQPKSKDASGVAGYGILNEGVESGQVDQKIRVDRNKGTDPALPPPVRKNEKGVVTEDPSNIQGGPIGPN